LLPVLEDAELADLAHFPAPSAINLVKATRLKSGLSDTVAAINPSPELAA
jgi:hypothetical protein